MSNITFEPQGKRVYVIGNTFPIKSAIKEAGGHWDGERKAWWIGAGKKEDLEKAISGVSQAEAPKEEPEVYDGEVQGKAEYKGRSYFIRWEGTTAKGESFRLVSFDGRLSFWASADQVVVTKRYEAREQRNFYGRQNRFSKPQFPTIAGIRKFTEDRKAGNGRGECTECGHWGPQGQACKECGGEGFHA